MPRVVGPTSPLLALLAACSDTPEAAPPKDWMIHCHIAEHGENGMMSEVQVLAAPNN